MAPRTVCPIRGEGSAQASPLGVGSAVPEVDSVAAEPKVVVAAGLEGPVAASEVGPVKLHLMWGSLGLWRMKVLPIILHFQI